MAHNVNKSRGGNVLRWVGITVLTLALLLLLSWVHHRFRLNKEAAHRKPLGSLITVNGYQTSFYATGAGETTLVFLAGGGTPSPILDFKSLYSLLDDDFRIAVVERPGYGFSEVVDAPRDLATVLKETRAVLAEAGIDPPNVICPHSMAGIEALYWAQEYPDEVQAIVGLDMALPEAYANLQFSRLGLRLAGFAARTGLTRLVPGLADGPAVRHGTLTEHDKAIYRALFYDKTLNRTMLDEMLTIRESAAKVAAGESPDVPMLLFVSNGEDTGFGGEEWREMQRNFAAAHPDRELILLDCGHYVHDFAYETIAEAIQGGAPWR